MNRLNDWLDRFLPRPSKELHDLLGWTLTVLLSLAGLLVMPTNPLTGLTCYAMAIAVCPKVEAPAWVRILFILISLFILS